MYDDDLYGPPWRCSCGRFLGKVTATIGFVFGEPESVKKVEGVCARHGLVSVLNNWDYEIIEEGFGPFEAQMTNRTTEDK